MVGSRNHSRLHLQVLAVFTVRRTRSGPVASASQLATNKDAPALRARSKGAASSAGVCLLSPTISRGMQVFTPILEEPPGLSDHRAASKPSKLPSPQAPSASGFVYFKDVVEAQARGDVLGVRLTSSDLNEKSLSDEILGQCGLQVH